MKELVEKIIENNYLTKEECRELMYAIAENTIQSEQIVAILVGIQMRGIQLDEIEGFREALLELALPLNISNNAIDLCGTGGDGKNTFNISTTTSLVLAAMNYKVIKHGNYGVSSSCGSSNVLEELGFQFSTDENRLQNELDTLNICFLHAPFFHPTLKKVASIRTNLGVRTLFNSLGPLVNPCQPTHQITGTYSLELAKIYQHILKNERSNYKIMYGLDGYDELTLSNSTRLLGKHEDVIRTAKNYNVLPINPVSLKGGDSLFNSARIVKEIISGIGSMEQSNVIAANCAEAITCIDSSISLIDAFKESLRFIRSGQTSKHFKLN